MNPLVFISQSLNVNYILHASVRIVALMGISICKNILKCRLYMNGQNVFLVWLLFMHIRNIFLKCNNFDWYIIWFFQKTKISSQGTLIPDMHGRKSLFSIVSTLVKLLIYKLLSNKWLQTPDWLLTLYLACSVYHRFVTSRNHKNDLWWLNGGHS